MRVPRRFHRNPVNRLFELSATICAESRVVNQQIINNGSCAECWPQSRRRAQGVEKCSWHGDMTRLEQCDGVSYGHDRTTLTPSGYWFGLRHRNDVTGFLLFEVLAGKHFAQIAPSCWRKCESVRHRHRQPAALGQIQRGLDVRHDILIWQIPN